MQPGPAGQRRTTVRIALFVLAIVVVLSVAELTSHRFKDFTGGHSLISTFLTEAVLLVGVYLVIDEIIQRRETRRWSDVMSLGIRALSARADGPAVIVRRAVDELLVEPTSPEASLDYQELVGRGANEFADWLLADPVRARSFADELRQSASRLEEAIIRWGPTLIEDPDSIELVNLLPDIVDSARSAADAIAAASGRLDRATREEETAGATRGWTDVDRQRWKDSLLDILKNADEFQRRVSRASS